MAQADTMPRRRAVLLDAWPLLLAGVLVLPLLTQGGHPLARDLVFVPRQPWTAAVLGLGDLPPRAVPLDALMAMATSLVDGGVVARIVLPLVLAVAGWGAHRLVRDLGFVARLAAGGFAVWNPYVVERLALGQWALLTAYAALPWLVMAAQRYRRDGRARDLASVVLWLALAAITPTGGLIGLGAVLVAGTTRAGARRTLALVGVGLALQLPWFVPGLFGAAALLSDPAGVAAFAARAEEPGGVVVSVLGLGGIWDSLSVPASRETWWGLAAAAVSVVVLVVGLPRLRRLWPGELGRWAVLAGGGLLLALVSSTPWGADALRWAVQEVPGAGLLRDSQKFLAPFVVLVVAAFAATVDRLVAGAASAGREVVAAAAVLLLAVPLALLPDAPAAVWPTVEPVAYPASVADLEHLFPETDDAPVATLPWRSYRRFDWGNGLISSDPALRLLDREVVVRDDLRVGDAVVQGESPWARDLDEALAVQSPASALSGSGIGWALVYVDDPDVDQLDLAGLEPVAETPEVALYRVPPGEEMPTPADDGLSDDFPVTALVVGVDLLAVLLVLAAALVRIRSRAGPAEWA